MKLLRFHSRKSCDVVLKKGRVWKGSTMMIHWLPGAPKHPNVDPTRAALYVGTFASLSLDKSAVKRNRMRRRVREALRLGAQNQEKLGAAQLLIRPRAASLTAPFESLQKDIQTFLSALPHA
jgi:ribonuclease P protein component